MNYTLNTVKSKSASKNYTLAFISDERAETHLFEKGDRWEDNTEVTFAGVVRHGRLCAKGRRFTVKDITGTIYLYRPDGTLIR